MTVTMKSPVETLRVAVVCPVRFAQHGYIGGGTRYPLELARAMTEVAECDFLVFGPEEDEFIDPYGLRHIVTPHQFGTQVTADAVSIRMGRLISGYDIVHFHTVNKMAVAGAALTRLRRRRAVLTPLGGGGATGIGRRLGLNKLFAGFAMISQDTEVELPWVRGRPRQVVYGGGDPSGLRNRKGDVSRRARIVYVGRLSAHKGLDVLIHALPVDAELVICGQDLDGEYVSDLRRLASGKRVEFIPPADDEALGELYASSAVVVLPSVKRDFRGVEYPHPELLGLTLLEAMWHSTPVVASRVGGVPEIVRDGENGLLVEAGNVAELNAALTLLLEDGAVSSRLGSAGRRMVEKGFTWGSVAERVFRFYQSLAA